MKKQMPIIIAVVVIVAIVAVFTVIAVKNKNSSNVGRIETVQDMKNMMNTVYSRAKEGLPSLEVTEIDATDADQVEMFTGLKSTENVEKVVVLEPLMSSQAYSAVAVKVKDGTDVEKTKQEILDNINMSKWICVSAEKLYMTNNGNVIFFVMSDEDWAKTTYTEFKKYVNNEVGKELEKTGEDGGELPPEMIVQ